MLKNSLLDHDWTRFALLSTTPVLGLVGLFFVVSIFANSFQLFGSIAVVKTNSRFYSAIKPNLSQAERTGFGRPHITIQMPVYKESLATVIIPTVNSLKAAISCYERVGGTANIFVNDDGLQYLSDDEREERISFYRDNNIGWVARPKHNDEGFIRAGKFKKASNMNYALNISNRVEDLLLKRIYEKDQTKSGFISSQDEEQMYNSCLHDVLAADGHALADGNIRVGEFILIVDSDTRIPNDCLLYGAAEMFLSPEVAIIQHAAGVMQVVGDYFENGVAYFTRLIYLAVRFSAGTGEVAPFVGHNAFLRWAAIQSVAVKGDDGYDRYWSESHVSEDFDIALRLQVTGNIVRLASYHGEGFMEGVSLTVYDELSRWEKYAYGCNELVFHPVRYWIFRGPLTPLFRRFLWSNMQLSSKISIIGYISTYYALAFALPLTIANYLLIGWFDGLLDKFYMESWKTFVSLMVVFGVYGNISRASLSYRLGEKTLLGALWENFKWAPMFIIFFSGISFHMFQATMAHMFSINMEWGATAKEAQNSNFFQEVPKILKTYKWMYICLIPCIGGMIYLGCFAERAWSIKTFNATVPLAFNLGSHIILPVSFMLLNLERTVKH